MRITDTEKLKLIPAFKTDEAAEDFLANADLTEYDWSDMKPTRFELANKDESIHLRLPSGLLKNIKTAAAARKMPYSRFIRVTLEHALETRDC